MIERLRQQGEVQERPESRIQQAIRRALGREAGRVVVRGLEDALVSLAKCCNPIQGDPIVGYITRGRGVSVHGDRCPNVENLLFDPERRIEVAWAAGAAGQFLVRIAIQGLDRPGLLARITAAIAEERSNIFEVEAHALEGKQGIVSLALEVADAAHLDRILDRLRGIEGIHSAERQYPGAGKPPPAG